MTTFNLTCEAVETLLHEYVDETLEPWVRESVDEHLSGCERCTGLARRLRNLGREAASLPALMPDRDVWQTVASRIGAPIAAQKPEEIQSTAEPDAVSETTQPVPLAAEEGPRREDPDRPPPPLAAEVRRTVRELSVPVQPMALMNFPPQSPLTAPGPTTPPAQQVSVRTEKSWGTGRTMLAAAALVIVTAATSSLLTARWLGTARTTNIATGNGVERPSSSEKSLGIRGNRAGSAGAARVASRAASGAGLTAGAAVDASLDSANPGRLNPSGARATALMVSTAPAPDTAGPPEDSVYRGEIRALRRIVRRQNPALEKSTVTDIDESLETLDSSIAQIRAALQKDPGNPLLSGQASRALEMKVELLRRAAMLRSTT